VRWFASGLVEVRRRIQRIGDYGERPPSIPRSSAPDTCSSPDATTFTDARTSNLIGVISQDLELWHAWRLVQMLYAVYEADSEAEAEAAHRGVRPQVVGAAGAGIQNCAQGARQVAAGDPRLPP